MPDRPVALTRTINIKRVLGALLFWVVVLSFWLPDLFVYPFRAFGPGPDGVYGTWTGIVRTAPSDRRGTATTFASEDTTASNRNSPTAGQSFAVAKLTVRPPLFSTLPNFKWRPSHELVGTLDVYLPDGTHQHCTHKMGGFTDSGQLQLIVYDRGENIDAIAEAQVGAEGLQFRSGMCPVSKGESVSFAGTLHRGSSGEVAALQRQLPAEILADREQVAAENKNFAREWVGPALIYDPDYKPETNAPNAVMHLQIVAVPGSAGVFTGWGEVLQTKGVQERFDLLEVTLKGKAFEASGTFHDLEDPLSINNGHGGLAGTVSGDTLVVTQGGKMLLRITGTLKPGR